MKRMKTSTARTLTWLAASLVVVGGIIMSPSGAFFSFTLAALVALFPAVFADGKVRIVAVILFFVSIGLSVDRYSEFKHEQIIYRKLSTSDR